MEKQISIVVIEDNKDEARLISRILEKAGYQTNIYHTGEEAIPNVLGTMPEMVIVDIRLPGIYGLEVIIRLRSSGYQKPIIAISSLGDTILKQAVALGCNNVISKPIILTEFMTVVDGYLLDCMDDLILSPEECAVATNAYHLSVATRLQRNTWLCQKMAADVQTTRNTLLHLIGHELRTPQSLVWGYSSLLKEDQSLPTNARMFVEHVFRAAERMNHLIEMVMTASNLVVGGLELNVRPVNLSNLLLLAVGAAEEQVKQAKRDIQFVIDSPDSANRLWLNCDPDKMLEAFEQVLSNAVKHTPEQGIVTLSIDCSCKAHVGVSILDQGAGFPPKFELRKPWAIHHSYCNHHSGRYDYRGNGLGLGLFIAKGIIEAHGGGFFIHEGVGQIDIKLPLGKETAVNCPAVSAYC